MRLGPPAAAHCQVRVLHVQRSCGYQWRPSIPIKEIARLCDHVRAVNDDRAAQRAAAPAEAGQLPPPELRPLVVLVDNCYGCVHRAGEQGRP